MRPSAEPQCGLETRPRRRESKAATRGLRSVTAPKRGAEPAQTKGGGGHYQIPYISMPEEIVVGIDGQQVPESKMPSAIRKYMAKLFRGKVLSIGKNHKVYIGKDGVEEYAFPARRISGEIKTAKMTAGANLDVTLKPAQFLKSGVDDGHHPEATGGWEYFYVMFETDTGIYSGIS